MKQAGNDTRIIAGSDGVTWGVFLAGNGCAEHEHGIQRMLSLMNIDDKGIRLAGRSMREPSELFTTAGQATRTYYLEAGKKPVKQTDKVAYLATSERSINTPEMRRWLVDRYRLDTDITGAWDDREFKLAGWTAKGKAAIEAIRDAALRGDLAIWIGNTPKDAGNPFTYPGLIIAIPSLMPAEARAAVDDSDDEALRLDKAVKATGILPKIDKHVERLTSYRGGPAYHALKPSWSLTSIGRDGETVMVKTRHPVMFFLNPARQSEFNSGWFTVEELELWLKGQGPVIKKKEKAA